MKEPKVVVYFGSRHIYRDMVSATKSLLSHTKVDKVYLLIEDDIFPYELPDNGIFRVMNIRDTVPTIFDPNSPNYHTGWTYIGLIRTALTKVFPQYDKVLSIDCDTIVVQDISELWDIPLDDYYFAAVREPFLSEVLNKVYVNAGVAMFNLDKLRKDGKDDEMICAMNTTYYRFVSQDIMSDFCQGGIYELPSDYNVSDFTEKTDNHKIYHYANRGAIWRDYPLAREYREKHWSEIFT